MGLDWLDSLTSFTFVIYIYIYIYIYITSHPMKHLPIPRHREVEPLEAEARKMFLSFEFKGKTTVN